MAISGDIIAQDGGQAKLHPYLVALVRWCVSCLWSTATVLLHRLMTRPLPQITGSSKPSKPRPAGREHLHPEPRVECAVLHQPAQHGLDVIFVHGLYGSLGNTWRQGEWRSKYHMSPEKRHLRRPTASPSPCSCPQCQKERIIDDDNNRNKEDSSRKNYTFNNNENKMTIFEPKAFENRFNNTNNDFNDAFTNIDEKFYKNIRKILPNDEVFITEKFYNNTLLDQVEIIDNYETQAQFVSDLFKKCDSNTGCENTNKMNSKRGHGNENDNKVSNNDEGNSNNNGVNTDTNVSFDCKCDKKCEMGCGCICDDCYSPCWPRDWIKVDYPDARVISINYTSDPHLWRPLWVKESKRLCLHERAEQMTEQLLALGVGEKPVVWVGHSKGGLFIKQIYCEAYEAYLKTHPKEAEELERKDSEERQKDNKNNLEDNNVSIVTENTYNSDNGKSRNNNSSKSEQVIKTKCGFECINGKINVSDGNENQKHMEMKIDCSGSRRKLSQSSTDEDALLKKSLLWSNSIALMLYSVPHRGSPLADIKTPLTARSVELMEISKDNALVLSLQERWLRATARSQPLVRSLVETRRTLMSVLWLRIVSEDSADPGIGALCGVSVDHREICKPSSRRCLLYTELRDLIQAGLNKFHNKI